MEANMRWRIVIVGLLSLQVFSAAVIHSQSQGALSVDYDTFMIKPLQEKIRVFNEISPENRALLVKTHAQRWLQANS